MSASLLLVWLVTLPCLGALLLAALPVRAAKAVAMGTALVGLVLGVGLFFAFDGARATDRQFAFSVPWIPSFQINFALAVDGLSLLLVVLTKFMMPIALLASW